MIGLREPFCPTRVCSCQNSSVSSSVLVGSALGCSRTVLQTRREFRYFFTTTLLICGRLQRDLWHPALYCGSWWVYSPTVPGAEHTDFVHSLVDHESSHLVCYATLCQVNSHEVGPSVRVLAATELGAI